jgi:hypothetical protein
MLKRLYDFLAVVTLLTGLAGMSLSFYFLFVQRFIEGFTSGLFGFLLLRTGVLILRLMVARNAIGDSQQRILEHLHDTRKL